MLENITMWNLEAFSTRHNVQISDAPNPFREEIDSLHDPDGYMFREGFDLFRIEIDEGGEDVGSKEVIATVKAVFF